MRKIILPAILILAAASAAAATDDPPAFLRADGPRTPLAAPSDSIEAPPWFSGGGPSLPGGLADGSPAAEPSLRGVGLNLFQEEIEPNLRLGLSLYARVDVPGDTSVDAFDNVAYSDIFDIGYGVNAELNLMSWVSPHWAFGGYFSIGWDRFSGASDVDMGTGEFFSFNDQDTVTAIFGGKVLHHFAPFWFWEGRMGVGLIHYGQLTFTDVTTPVAVSGLQFFRPVNHGLFDLGGRIGVGDKRITFDLGLDFRFMGSEARGRDVTNAIDPDWFFVFSIDLGVSFRF